MSFGGLPLFVTTIALAGAVAQEGIEVSFLEFPPAFMMGDHKCRHGAVNASVRLQVIPDVSVKVLPGFSASALVDWQVQDLDKAAPKFWSSDPDACNVAPGAHRAFFRSANPEVEVASRKQDFHVKSGSTTMLWLRVKNSTHNARWRYYYNEAINAPTTAPTKAEVQAWKATVQDYNDAVKIEDAAKKCLRKNGNCSVDATCSISLNAAVICTCNDGYNGDGYKCEEPKNCASLGVKCPSSAVCKMISEDHASCFCKQGYKGIDNMTNPICHPINPCLSPSRGNCSRYAFCEMSAPGASRCSCNYGYVGSGKKCTAMEKQPVNNGTNATANNTENKQLNAAVSPAAGKSASGTLVTSDAVLPSFKHVDSGPSNGQIDQSNMLNGHETSVEPTGCAQCDMTQPCLSRDGRCNRLQQDNTCLRTETNCRTQGVSSTDNDNSD